MRIALVAPPYPLAEAPSPPLGLSYVAAACREQGAEVRVWDYVVSRYSREKLAGQIREFSPDVVGAGPVTMNFPLTVQILADVKSIDPGITTMMGGPHVSFCAEEVLRENGFVDLVVIGEAEATLAELAPRLKSPSCWREINGIAFNDNGNVLRTAPRELIQQIDTIPLPARDLLPLSRYKALGFPISVLTSRGCPYRCIFCQGRRLVGAKPRLRSPQLVVEEIESILSLGFDRINIADDLFLLDARRAQTICEEIIRRGLKFAWSAFVRANTVEAETLRLMRRAGCDSVSFGVESGNEAILKEIRKGITLEMAQTAVRLCQEAGLVVLVSFIAGLPSETGETLQQTRDFAAGLNCHYGFHLLAPFPGTTLREDVARYDLEILSNDWSQYDANHAVTRTSALSAEQVEGFISNFERELSAPWEEHLSRWRKNINPPEIEMQVEGYQRMRLIFRLLAEDLLEVFADEGKGSSGGAKGEGDAFQRIAAATGFERDFVVEVIDDLRAKGVLPRTNT